MKKILMLLQSTFPPDIRLEKEIRSLNSAGYHVTVLCNQYIKNAKIDFEGCDIIRLKAYFNNEILNKVLNFPIFFNPRFIFKSITTFLKIRPNYLHAHDLPMVPLGLLLKLFFKVPVIFDMHENYPEALKEFKKKGIINFLFKNYRMAKTLENYCLQKVDRIITVVEENFNRLVKRGVPEYKVIVVSNTVDITSIKSCVIKNNSDETKFEIIYSGGVSPERDLETSVLAMKYLKDELPEARLIIVGDGASKKVLKELMDKNKLSDVVKLIDWPGHEEALKLVCAADLCIIPQPSNSFIDTTIPHKLFEYMALSKPILVSDAKPLKRIVEETNCGRVFKSRDPQSFAEQVIKLKNSDSDYGKNGRKAVEKKYNWKIDEQKLLDLYSQLNTI